MSNGPPSQRDRRSLQDLAKLANTSNVPLSSRTPTPPPPSVKVVGADSGIVDLKQIATDDAGAAERAKTTPLASAPLFEDETPSVPPPPSHPSSRPGLAAPAAGAAPAASSRRLVAKAPETANKSSVLVPVLLGLLLAGVAAAVFVVARPHPAPAPVATPAQPAVAAAPTAPAAPPPVASSAQTPTAPADSAPVASAAAPDPAPSAAAADSPRGPVAAGGRRSGAAAKKDEPPGGSAVSGLSAMMAQATNSTTTQAPLSAPAAPASLGDAVKNAVGDKGAAPAAPPGAPSGPQFAPGSVPDKPSQGAVTGGLGRALPQARACLNPDDPISRANVTFSSTGAVTAVVVSGNAAGKPAEDCIKRALFNASVPPFVQPSYSANVTIRPN